VPGRFFVGAQGVLYRGEDARPTLTVSYFHRAYDGPAPEFDFGSPINSFLVLGSGDVKGFHYDANAFFTELVQEPLRRSLDNRSPSPMLSSRTSPLRVRSGSHFYEAMRWGIFGQSATLRGKTSFSMWDLTTD